MIGLVLVWCPSGVRLAPVCCPSVVGLVSAWCQSGVGLVSVWCPSVVGLVSVWCPSHRCEWDLCITVTRPKLGWDRTKGRGMHYPEWPKIGRFRVGLAMLAM